MSSSGGDLGAVWTVLETEARRERAGIAAIGTGTRVAAGEVLVGVDASGRRVFLVPARAGEALAEDRTGQAVHVVRLEHQGVAHLAVVCVEPSQNAVFGRFCYELLADLDGCSSGCRMLQAAFIRWRGLFAAATGHQRLTDERYIGLVGELLALLEIIQRDASSTLAVWTGPDAREHDFVRGHNALEVKATTTREGRVIPISSIDQLLEPPGGALYLAWYRLAFEDDGLSVAGLVEQLVNCGAEQAGLETKLAEAGYLRERDEGSRATYRVAAWAMYDVIAPEFPKMTVNSFADNRLPSGVLRVRYSVDATNEPPTPLPMDEVEVVWATMAGISS